MLVKIEKFCVHARDVKTVREHRPGCTAIIMYDKETFYTSDTDYITVADIINDALLSEK